MTARRYGVGRDWIFTLRGARDFEDEANVGLVGEIPGPGWGSDGMTIPKD